MLVNIPDDMVYETISGLKLKHRLSNCTYCGDNMDGSPTACALSYIIRLLERKYKELRDAS